MKVYSSYSLQSTRKAKTRHLYLPRKLGIVLLVVTTTLLVLLKVATWLNAQELFLLKDVLVEGNKILKDTEIIKYVKVDSESTLLEYDVAKLINQVQQHPLVSKAWVSRKLPSTLVIKVKEKEPLAILNESELVAIDEAGKAMPVFRNEMLFDIPIISGLQKANNENALHQVLDFLHFTKYQHFSLYCEISEVSYSTDFGIYFYLNESAIPVIWGKTNSMDKSQIFETVLSLVRSENKLSQIKYFDLRFKNQVILKEFRV